MTTYDMKIAQRLRVIRQIQGVSQAEFARRLGISRMQVSQIETGKIAVSADVLSKIASMYHINLQTIVSDDDELNESSAQTDSGDLCNKAISMLKVIQKTNNPSANQSFDQLVKRVAYLKDRAQKKEG